MTAEEILLTIVQYVDPNKALLGALLLGMVICLFFALREVKKKKDDSSGS